ncbi:MAG: EAL and HDOD domain-containing protein [Janthinobacterium lividum]
MSTEKFIVRQPILDPKHKVAGYEFWFQKADADTWGDEDLQHLAMLLAAGFNDAEAGWQMRELMIYMNATPAFLGSDAVLGMRPENTVFTLSRTDFASAETTAAVRRLRGQGYNISLRDDDLMAQAANLARCTPMLLQANRIELNANLPDLDTRVAMIRRIAQPGSKLLVRHVQSWELYERCTALNVGVFASEVYMSPQPGTPFKDINPSQTVIVQLMQLVRQNASVRELEHVMKRDAALSFKLFRYINSVGFGLGAEIESLRHAVTLLGYKTLYRWLSLLLATASSVKYGAVLMQTAMIRARFVELLGQGLMTTNESEDLFVIGLFSMLDRLMGMTIEQVMAKVNLSEPITEALLTRTGMYGPFLALAEACEDLNGNAAQCADELFLTARQVNEAQLQAVSWAQNLGV